MRSCKKCYVNRGISRWAGLWDLKSAILHCCWCPFVSNHLSLSLQKLIFQNTQFFPNWVTNDIFNTSLKGASVKCDISQELTRNPIFIRGRSRTPAYDNIEVNNFLLKTIVTSNFIFGVSRGTWSASSKVRRFNMLHSCFSREKHYLLENIIAEVGSGFLQTSNMELSVPIVVNLWKSLTCVVKASA